MSGSTQTEDGDLDEALALIKYEIEYGDAHGGCPPKVNAVHRHGAAEAKQHILALKSTWQAEARLDELERYMTFTSDPTVTKWHLRTILGARRHELTQPSGGEEKQ